MAAAEVFLLMSRAECLPNVVKQAMASRCVCIVTDTMGIAELVEDGTSGFVVAPGDSEGAAQRIDYVFGNPAHAPTIGAAARQHVIANFDVRRAMRLYQQCWHEIVAAQSVQPHGAEGEATTASTPNRRNVPSSSG
jgi:glycosyltransferase involved in cell wall biosynthesis